MIRDYHVDYVVAAIREADVPSIPARYVVNISSEFDYHGHGRFLIIKSSYWEGKLKFGFPPWWVAGPGSGAAE